LVFPRPTKRRVDVLEGAVPTTGGPVTLFIDRSAGRCRRSRCAAYADGNGDANDAASETDRQRRRRRRTSWASVCWSTNGASSCTCGPLSAVRPARLKVQGLPALPAVPPQALLASVLIANGPDGKDVQARLRHASATRTLDPDPRLWPDEDDGAEQGLSWCSPSVLLHPLRPEAGRQAEYRRSEPCLNYMS